MADRRDAPGSPGKPSGVRLGTVEPSVGGGADGSRAAVSAGEISQGDRRFVCAPYEGCGGNGHHGQRDGKTIWCVCPAGLACRFCLSGGYFDAGRGEEHHTCRLPPGHPGDHEENGITWRDRPPTGGQR